MAIPPKNRHTQIDMFELTGDKSTVLSTKDTQNNKKPQPIGRYGLKPPPSPKVKKVRPTLKSSALQLRAAWKSPWDKYEKIYDLELGGPVAVAVRKVPPIELVHVRAFLKPVAEKALHMFRQLQHHNIIAALDAFTTDEGLFIILEHMPISLDRIVSSPAYPDEQQLAAILGQILNGVAYLSAEGFEHGSLCCSNIFLNTNGEVKIANQECCHLAETTGDPCDLRALSPIVMELMQKYVKEDGAIGIDDLHRWHPNSNAVGFLSATTSATSTVELLKHPLLTSPWRKESLLGLISLAQVCLRGRYKYTPKV